MDNDYCCVGRDANNKLLFYIDGYITNPIEDQGKEKFRLDQTDPAYKNEKFAETYSAEDFIETLQKVEQFTAYDRTVIDYIYRWVSTGW